MDESLKNTFQLFLQKLRDVGHIEADIYSAICPSNYGDKHYLTTSINEESIAIDCDEGCNDSSIIKGVGMD